MELLKMIAMPISGAIIGYSTNWLAIKMLFRPRQEKYLFGIKLPFTPGLIPKERFKLAKSVGNTVGKNLLTEDVIVQSLGKPEVKNAVKQIFSEIYKKASECDYTVADLLDKAGFTIPTELVAQKIYDTVAGDDFSALVSKFVVDSAEAFSKKPVSDHKLDKLTSYIGDFYMENRNSFFDNEKLSELVQSFLSSRIESVENSDKHLGMFLPENFITYVDTFLQSNMKPMFSYANQLLENEKLISVFTKVVSELINESIGKFFSIFVNPEKICENMLVKFKEYINNDENIPDAIAKIDVVLIKILSLNVGEGIASVPQQLKQSAIDKAIDFIKFAGVDSNIVPNTINSFNSFLEKNDDRTLHEFLMGIDSELFSKFQQLVASWLNRIIVAHGKQTINSIATELQQKICQFKIRDITISITPSVFSSFENFVISNIDNIIKRASPYIIKAVDIPQVVEDRLNSFQVEEAENIILGVVNRELQAITTVGGVLGFLIGLLPIIFNI